MIIPIPSAELETMLKLVREGLIRRRDTGDPKLRVVHEIALACLPTFLATVSAELRGDGAHPLKVAGATAELAGHMMAAVASTVFSGIEERDNNARRMLDHVVRVMTDEFKHQDAGRDPVPPKQEQH